MAKDTTPALATPYDPVPEEGQPRPQLPAVAESMTRMQTAVVTAQNVHKPRNEVQIRNKLVAYAAAAGEKYFYTLPFKTQDGKTNVMGPSIKLCSDVARLWGNCEVDCKFVQETPTHFVFEGIFIDWETGYVLHRPFLQRKEQNVGMKDAGRALDMIFQIAASKATRNVIHRALPDFVDTAYETAVQGLANKVGKDADGYRERIKTFLAKVEIPLKRIERIYGKPLAKMDNHDLAKLAAQCTAVNDNMIDAEEQWPRPEAGDETEPKKVETSKKTDTAKPKADAKKADKPKAESATKQEQKKAESEKADAEESPAEEPAEQEAAKPEPPAEAEPEAAEEQETEPAAEPAGDDEGELRFD